MSPTPLPSLRELFPSKRHRSPVTIHIYGGLTSFADLIIKPQGDDLRMSSRPITPQLVLDRGNPSPHLEHHLPTTPVIPLCLRRESDPGRGPSPSEASRPIDADDFHDHKTRKHVCHHCGKRFNRPSSLTIHYHTHTGERREYHSFPLFHSLE